MTPGGGGLPGPLLASTPEFNVRLEARASADDHTDEPGIPTGQKVMLDSQITDAHTGQPPAGLSPTGSLESSVPIPSNPYGPADTADPFDARDIFVLVNGAGDLGVLESDGTSSHRHQPGSSLTQLTGSHFAALVKLPGPDAEAVADRGIYQADVTFPTGGSFSATLSSLSAGLSPGDVPATTLDVAGA